MSEGALFRCRVCLLCQRYFDGTFDEEVEKLQEPEDEQVLINPLYEPQND